MISGWKQELVTRAGELFARGNKAPAVADAQRVIDDLHRKIGQLQVERDFLAGQPAISPPGSLPGSQQSRGGGKWNSAPSAAALGPERICLQTVQLGAAKKYLERRLVGKWDQRFESPFLQRGVRCEPRAGSGCRFCARFARKTAGLLRPRDLAGPACCPAGPC
jgi:hypothetical protein